MNPRLPRTTFGRTKKLLAASAVLATLGIAGTAAAQNYGYYVSDGYYGNGYYNSGYYGRVYVPAPSPYYTYAPRPYAYYPSGYYSGYYYDPPANPYPGTLGVRVGPFFLGL